MINFHNVNKCYEKTKHEALRFINLDISKGEIVFLTGHSGAGKSTLLKLTMLIERPTRGEIIVNGKNLNKLAKWQIPYLRRTIGVIFQDPMLLPERTVFENVAIPLIAVGTNHREIGKKVRAALTMVSLLDKEKRFPVSLSAGEQQRVGIARAIVNRPQLLLADEPTGNLDPELSLEIMRLFEQLNQTGTTALIASHDLSLITNMPHRILTLKAGELIKDEQNVGIK